MAQIRAWGKSRRSRASMPAAGGLVLVRYHGRCPRPPAKHQLARRHFPAIPPAAAIATTVLRSARIIPQAGATNSRRAGLRANTGASSSSRSRQVDGMGRLADLAEAAYDLFAGGSLAGAHP